MASTKREQLHAVAIPLPGQGHINPLMRFCKRLASQEAFTITFLDIAIPEPLLHFKSENVNKQEHESTHDANLAQALSKQKLHDTMDANSKQQASTVLAAAAVAEGHGKLDIRRVSIPLEIPANLREGSSILEIVFEAVKSLPPLIEELLSRLIHEDPPITCLISDLYMTGPMQKIADKFNIPRVALHTTSQSVLLFNNYILEGTISLEEVLKVVTSKDASKEDTFVEGLPGLPPLRNGDLMNFQDDNVWLHGLNLEILKESKERAHAIVVNTMKELEEPGLEVDIGGIPVYAVGPLVEPLERDTNTSLWKEDMDCMLWLNEQPSLSVLYISFGSFAALSKAQFEEISAGLISSQQHFLWVSRRNLVHDASFSTLHLDLLSQSQGKGYITEWAPQLRVLSHPSVGGFLTHCGWNSTIEAITLGVPMLCFPYISDQFINAKFITQEWKVGLGFKMCKESGLVKRDEVERVIWALMVGEEGKLLQRNAKYFKEISNRNLQLESTSSKNIEALVHSLR